MPLSSSVRLVSALLLLRAIDALRGAHPSNDTRLSSGVVCVPRDAPGNPPVSLPPSRVNDDYCDCADGADEPGTAACPGAVFWCRNAAFRPVKLPSSWVDDGSCDCCDGSDEPAGACPDTCGQEKERVLSVAKKQAGAIRAGVTLREKYAKDAAKAAENDKREIEKLEKELKVVQRQVKKSQSRAEELRKRRDYEDEMRRAAEKHSAPPATDQPADDDNQDEVDTIDEDEDEHMDDGDDDDIDDETADLDANDPDAHDHAADEKRNDDDHLDDEVKNNAEAERKEIDTEAHPDPIDDSDGDVKDDDDDDDIDEQDDYDEDDFKEDDDEDDDDDGDSNYKCSDCEKDDTDDEEEEKEKPKPEDIDVDMVCAELGARGPNFIVRAINYLRIVVVSRLQQILPISSPALASRERISECLRKADSAKYDLDNKQRDVEDKLKKLKEKSTLYYGSDGALRNLHGKCVKKAVTQYEFEICPFDVVRQYEHGSSIAVLGRFKGWKGEDGNKLMNYAQGDRCWNGPPRSIKVELCCGETEEIVSVEEPNRCAYFMKFKTPAVCESTAADTLLAQFEQTGSEPKEEL